MDLSPEQYNTVFTVYSSAIIPTVVVLLLQVAGKLPRWVFTLWIVSFLICAFGWELWLTYGILDGADVDSRRPEALSLAIPMHINWLLNSLADASAIGLFGVLLVWLFYGRKDTAFKQWHWGAFAILFVWFVGQNLWVELFVYQTQLREGLRLSWAPLIPTGPWFNPILFTISDRSVQLQTQLPWILMTPIYYWLLVRFYRAYSPVGREAK
jgi:hypothetical protein